MSDARTEPFRLGYRPWLDGLRALAILAVLAHHLRLLPGGFLGVDLFFVLSGFLITVLLAQEWEATGAIRLGPFYLRRALRLLPALFALMLVVGAVTWLTRPERTAAVLRECAVAACYLSNWQAELGVPMAYLGHTWSLSIEEQFYLLWPPLLLALLWCRRRWVVLAAVAAGVVAAALVRSHLASQLPADWAERSGAILRLYMGLHTRADALLVGCLVGLMTAWGMLPVRRRWTGTIALLSAVGLAWMTARLHMDHSQLYRWKLTAVALMVAAVLVHLLTQPAVLVRGVLGWRPLVWVGRLSYSVYLFHIPVFAWVEEAQTGWPTPVLIGVRLAASFAAAALCHYAVERPFLRLKDATRPAPSLPVRRAA